MKDKQAFVYAAEKLIPVAPAGLNGATGSFSLI